MVWAQGVGALGILIERDTRELFYVMKMFYILIKVTVTWVCVLVKLIKMYV